MIPRGRAMRQTYLPLAATIAVFVALFVVGGALYNHFLSTLVLGDILDDNAFLIIAAIGANFVILSGGIDLSIGSMIGFVGVVMAKLDGFGWHPLASAALMLRLRRGLRRAAGAHHRLLRDPALHRHARRPVSAARRLLHGDPRFRCRCAIPSSPISRAWPCRCPATDFSRVRRWRCSRRWPLAVVIAHRTSFGADVYAIGGDRTSAALMGVPMRRTTVKIYALGGLYSALGGVIYALYTSSGYPLAGSGNELSAIAAVVLGGTLLTGGVGLVVGALFGGMILGSLRR